MITNNKINIAVWRKIGVLQSGTSLVQFVDCAATYFIVTQFGLHTQTPYSMCGFGIHTVCVCVWRPYCVRV